jgi:hypothetical protein
LKKLLFAALSLTSLIFCLVAPVLYFFQKISNESYKLIFLIASVSWFVFAIAWSAQRNKSKNRTP